MQINFKAFNIDKKYVCEQIKWLNIENKSIFNTFNIYNHLIQLKLEIDMDKIRNRVSCIAVDEVISTQTQKTMGEGMERIFTF